MAAWSDIGSRSRRSVQAGTEAAPSGGPQGMPLDSVGAVSVWLDAGEGETISADAGQADVYVYDNGAWGDAPLLVLAVPPGSTGKRRVQLWTVRIDNPRGYLAVTLNGVQISGANATVEMLATAHSSTRRAVL